MKCINCKYFVETYRSESGYGSEAYGICNIEKIESDLMDDDSIRQFFSDHPACECFKEKKK